MAPWSDIRQGMLVVSVDGINLGRVLRVDLRRPPVSLPTGPGITGWVDSSAFKVGRWPGLWGSLWFGVTEVADTSGERIRVKLTEHEARC